MILALERRLMLDASLPVVAGQVLWLDASDSSTILDADGDNAADGTGGNNDGFSGSVQTWQDKSGSGFDVTAPATGNQPQYGVDTQNGHGVITFDGSDDWLRNTTAQITDDDVTMFIVYNRTAATGRDALMEVGSGGSRNAPFVFATNYISYYSSGTFDNGDLTTYSFNEYHVASIVHSNNTVQGHLDNVEFLNEATNVRTSTTGLYIGNDSTDGDELTGTIAEVLVYDRSLTAEERHDVETYLAGKWDFTITNTDPTLDTNTGITLDEGATLTISNTELASSDADNSDAHLIYTITDAVNHGTLSNTDTAQILSVGDSFTQSDIDNGYITYTHDDSATTADSFIFGVSDGYGSDANHSFDITVNEVGTSADIAAIPNAVLHFDATDIDHDGDTTDQPADGAAVGRWTDGASPSNDATSSGSTQPLYDADAFGYNKGGIVYDGVNDELDLPTTSEVNNSTFTEKSYAFAFRTGTDIVSDQLIYEQGGTTHGMNFGIFSGHLYAYQYRNGAADSYAIDLGDVNSDTTYQVIAIFDSGANTWSANVNNGAFTTIATSGTMPGHSGAPGLGNENGATIHPITHSSASGLDFAGALGEFWSWNHALTAGEIIDVQDYLTDKWFDSAPSLTTNATLDVAEDALASITSAHLETNDAEVSATMLTYTLTALPTQGTLYLSGIALGLSDTFTQSDVNSGLLIFDHDGTAAPTADSFDFSVYDGYNTAVVGTFSFNVVTASATDPIVVADSGLSLNEGATGVITAALLDTNDGDTADTGLSYTITSDVSHGTLYNNGVALGTNDTFTQQNIVDGLITYTHDDSENFTDSFIFTVTDGTTTTSPVGFLINIAEVNDEVPSNISLTSTTVNENVSNGTVVGTLSTADADLPGDSFTYSIIADPDSKFQIVGDQLRTSASLNREVSASHSVTIRVNDGVHIYDKLFTITVNDLNENPTDIALGNNTIAENSANGTVIGTLSATDPDLPGDSFTYSIIADPDSKFQIVGNQLRVGGGLDFETSNAHNVTIRVNDGNGGTRNEVFTINVTNINDTPVITAETAELSQGETIVLTTSVLTATDQDNPDAGLIYEITTVPTDGVLALNGTALGLNDTFTQQDILDGNVTYAHDNTASVTSDSFAITVTDGTATSAASTVMLDLKVLQTANNAPTVAEGGDTDIQTANLAYDIDWYDNNWSNRRLITVDSAMVDSDLTDYTLLITESGFDANFWSTVKADGSDIIITDSLGNKLDRELVSIDTASETMQLYVRTDLSSTVDTDLYIYYGNAAASETNDTTTWTNEYVGVWHFDDDFNDGDAADSSQAGNAAMSGNGFDNTNSVAGLTGNAAEFNNNEYLALNYAYSGNNTLSEISVSAWVNTTVNGAAYNDNWALIDFDRSEFFDVFISGSDGTVGFSTAGSGLGVDDFYSTGVSVNDGNWHQIAAVYDGSDKILYVDGIEVARDVNTYSGVALGQGTRFGFIGDGSEAGSFDAGRNNLYYDGLYDDIRLYEGTMDSATIAAEYRNHSNPGTFYSIGTHGNRTINTQYTLTDLPDNGTLYLDANLNGTRDGGETLVVNDTFTQSDIDTGYLRYEHDGGETTSDVLSFTVSDMNGHTTASQDLNITITPVNDAPTDITIDNDLIDENSSSGTLIGVLGTDDVDLPGDSFTYSIISDPDGKFQIVGDQLQVSGSLDYEQAQFHTLTLRSNDGNGGTVDKDFTILVGNLADDFVPPQSEGDGQGAHHNVVQTTNGLSAAEQRTTLHKLQNNVPKNAIIEASLISDVAQDYAYYGHDSLPQIVREHTTLNIREHATDIQTAPPPEVGNHAQNISDIEKSSDPQPEESAHHYTNLREALKELEQFHKDRDEKTKDKSRQDNVRNSAYFMKSAEQQFVDVLTYHEQKQQKLEWALLGL